ncbi:short-chain protein [Diaporthe amygdali]|uniref:short-chain protein n=1 Tax=Phomopsis amygdali TaxID=1214568 RepID=UPI0022FE071D|nr:short-chain protein [Diaporthe amygdali]KAJ0122337.1 short-chain protein [Diaporthe amygdali]
MVSSNVEPDLPKFTTPARPLTWLITGCSSGFGLAIARHAQANGHRVIATSRNPAKTPELMHEIETNGGKWVQLDLDDPSNGKVIDELEAEGTPVDVIVNNAGVALLQAVEHITEDEVRAQFETVFFGPYRLTRAALPYMRKRRFGIIVNISTGASLEGRESMGIYSASKAAFDGLTKVLAKEVAEFNIRTLTVYLGGFNTQFSSSAVSSGKEPLSDDYDGTVVSKTLQFMHGGKYVADGDTLKGAKAVYEVVMGEGVGAGKEAELNLPLGREMEARVKLVRDRMDHCWEVFGDVASNVYIKAEH